MKGFEASTWSDLGRKVAKQRETIFSVVDRTFQEAERLGLAGWSCDDSWPDRRIRSPVLDLQLIHIPDFEWMGRVVFGYRTSDEGPAGDRPLLTEFVPVAGITGPIVMEAYGSPQTFRDLTLKVADLAMDSARRHDSRREHEGVPAFINGIHQAALRGIRQIGAG